ncbi:BnaC04g13190D [Brassica napus]|uniref:BnaC04g13190D protein n=2 Tax=Brassica napus TaxID=3708 RepID=A0A078H7G7_BRANA|nr:BnaC04g13190D [Brassica napus]
MWILRDPEKHGWYPGIFKLPSMWKDVVAGEELLFRGVTATNEFVLSCNCKSSSEPFHVYYYNFIKETITRVEIQGMGAFERGSIVGLFTNHGADVKLV